METKNVSQLAAALAEIAYKASEADKNILQQTINNLWSGQQEIDKLQADLKKEKEDRQADKTDFETRLKQDRIDHSKRDIINSSATIYDELDKDVKFTTVDKLVSKALNEKISNSHSMIKVKCNYFIKTALNIMEPTTPSLLPNHLLTMCWLKTKFQNRLIATMLITSTIINESKTLFQIAGKRLLPATMKL